MYDELKTVPQWSIAIKKDNVSTFTRQLLLIEVERGRLGAKLKKGAVGHGGHYYVLTKKNVRDWMHRWRPDLIKYNKELCEKEKG